MRLWNNAWHDAELKVWFLEKLRENKKITLTNYDTSNKVFSFGRDYGHYGRILTQTVVSIPTIQVRKVDGAYFEITGFCFTPQDGNALASSVAATLWHLHGDWEEVGKRMGVLDPYLFQEI